MLLKELPILENYVFRITVKFGVKGIVTVFEAGDEPKILAQNDLDEKIMATPAVVDNKLYIRTAGSLYAFGED